MITTRRIWARLLLGSMLVVVCSIVISSRTTKSVVNQFSLHEEQILLSSLEFGPIEALQSSSLVFAEDQLKMIFERNHTHKLRYASASIHAVEDSPGGSDEKLISWISTERQLIAKECLSSNIFRVSPQNSLRHYRIVLEKNTCHSFGTANDLVTFYATSTFFLVFIIVCVFLYLSYPIAKSILNSEKVLRGDKTKVDHVVFIPIKRLLLKAIKNVEDSASNAIAETTRMFAHDVRRPFALLKSLVAEINTSKSEKEINSTLEAYLPDISKAIVSVEDMIKDIMEIGAVGQLHLEERSFYEIFSDSLGIVLGHNEKADIYIESKYPEKLMLNVNPQKFARVIENILINAIEHMNNKGKIWISSSAPIDGLCQITIGNSNSYIPPEDIINLFKPYFTKGKTGGTGLGLAIVKKIVESHGGTIECRSSLAKGTEFVFCIAGFIGNGTSVDSALPCHSAEYLKAITKRDTTTMKASEEITDENSPKNQIAPKSKTSHVECLKSELVGERKYAILFEDEPIYQRQWRRALGNDNLKIFSRLEPDVFENVVENDSRHIAYIITDFYLENDDTGIDVAKYLRGFGWKGPIFLSSNVSDLPEDESKFFDLHVDKDPIISSIKILDYLK